MRQAPPAFLILSISSGLFGLWSDDTQLTCHAASSTNPRESPAQPKKILEPRSRAVTAVLPSRRRRFRAQLRKVASVLAYPCPPRTQRSGTAVTTKDNI